jgi:hypothetical protein
MSTTKKPDFMELVKKTAPVMGGAVLGDIALDLINDYVMPMIFPPPAPNTPPVFNAMTDKVPALILLAGGLGIQYYAYGQKDKEMMLGLGTGLVASASIELGRKLMPDLSGQIGQAIIDPLMRIDRTIPNSKQISR